MKTVSRSVKITFWISTILVAAMTVPAVFMTNLPDSVTMFNHLGVGAEWFRWELEWAKTVAGIILLLPMIRGRIKEWAYVGLGIDFISAFIAMTATDGISSGAPILLAVVILAISYVSYHKMNAEKISLI